LGLLFYLGLELDARRLNASGHALALSAIGAALSFSFGFAAARLLGLAMLDAALAGGLIAVSSTVAVLSRKDAADWPLLGAVASFEDAGGVLLWLAVAGAAVATGFSLAYSVLAFLALLLAVRFCAKRLDTWLARKGFGEGMLVFALAAGLFGAGLMDALLSLPLSGAYLAGAALSASVAGERIRREMPLFRDVMVLFFFVASGALTVFDGAALALAGVLFAALLLARAFSFSGFFGRFFSKDTGFALGAGTLVLGEFTLLIGAAALALTSAGSVLVSAAVLLVTATSVLSAVSAHFVRAPHPRVRAAPAGQERARMWSATKHAVLFAGVAVAVCMLATLLSPTGFPSLFGLDARLVGALLVLPFIVWPVYKSLSSLRLAVSLGVADAFGAAAAVDAGEAVAGALALVGGLFVFSLVYDGGPSAFSALAGVYVVLSFLFLSHLLWRRPDYVDSDATAGFLAESRAVAVLNAERLLAQQRIAQSLSAGDKASARKVLSEFRKKEAAVLEKSGRRTNAHPFRAKNPRRRHLEGYFRAGRRTR
ncbi:MAG: hypothetical protein Q8P02_02320, partial [Candidatus Micrarchaeota archaeon]|nr:hypothetical protein [Candidatus Micrarchaeota archaeon]